MALFKILRGSSVDFHSDLSLFENWEFNGSGTAQLKTDNSVELKPKFNDGFCYFLKDTGMFYVDYAIIDEETKVVLERHRVPLNAKTAETLTKNLDKDWRQNDENASDYIKNRTHWIEESKELVIQETNSKIIEQDYIFIAHDDEASLDSKLHFKIIPNDIYIITVNDIEYKVSANTWIDPDGISHVFLGDSRLMDGYQYEVGNYYNSLINLYPQDVPFAMLYNVGIIMGDEYGYTYQNRIMVFGTENDAIIKIEHIIPFYHALDYRYIDSITEINKGLEQKFWRGTKEEYDNIAIKDDGTLYLITDQFEVIESIYMDQEVYDPQQKKTDIFKYAEDTHKTPKTGLILTDLINGKNYVIQMINGNLVSRPYIISLSIKTEPAQMVYSLNEAFNPAGMIVEALYEDGTVEEIDFYKYNAIVTDFNFPIYYDQAGNIVEVILELTER